MLIFPLNNHSLDIFLSIGDVGFGENQSFIHDRPVLDDFARLEAARGSDNDLRLAIFDAIGEFLCSEAAENNRMDSADTGASKHEEGRNGNHRHVEEHTVALGHTELLSEHRGDAANTVLHLLVGEFLLNVEVGTVIDKGNIVAVAAIDMLINCIVADVDHAVREPAIEWGVALIEDRRVGLVPVNLRIVSEPVEVGRLPLGNFLN